MGKVIKCIEAARKVETVQCHHGLGKRSAIPLAGRVSRQITEYFSKSQYDWRSQVRSEQPEACAAHQKINFLTEEARRVVAAAGVPSVVQYIPPPIMPQYVQNIDLLANIFSLDSYKIGPDRIVETLERAMGVYQSDYRGAVLRTVNPFWWASRAFIWLARRPFAFLTAAGFDGKKAEQSFLGKLIKAGLLLVSAMAAGLTIANLTGWLPKVRLMLPSLFGIP